MDFSIVIPTHNRKELLKKTLYALFAQTYSPLKFEIIVVGDSADGTEETVEELAETAPCTLKYISVESCGPSKKRNRGIKEAEKEIVVFTDDDSLPRKDWLEKIAIAFEKNPDAKGIEGKILRDEKIPLFHHATENLTGDNYQTCNIAYKKDVLEELGGFDEGYFFFREDTDMAFRVLERGEIVFEPSAVVYHPPRKMDVLSVLRELFLLRGEVRLYKKFPMEYTKKFQILGGGGTKKAVFAWFSFLLLVFSISSSIFFAVVFGILIFKYKIELRGHSYSLSDATSYVLLTYVRDLLYPFFLSYYWLKAKH